jgi:hypothetical protein
VRSLLIRGTQGKQNRSIHHSRGSLRAPFWVLPSSKGLVGSVRAPFELIRIRQPSEITEGRWTEGQEKQREGNGGWAPERWGRLGASFIISGETGEQRQKQCRLWSGQDRLKNSSI